MPDIHTGISTEQARQQITYDPERKAPYTPEEVCAIVNEGCTDKLRLPVRKLKDYIRDGYVPVSKLGFARYIPAQWLHDFMQGKIPIE